MQEIREQIQPFFSSLFYPTQVKTNKQMGLMRLIACICMFIDHIGAALFPRVAILRIIGRLAFPCFAYGIAMGAIMTHDGKKYLSRVIFLTLFCQPFYAVALRHETPAMYAVPWLPNFLKAAGNYYYQSFLGRPSILVSLALALAIILAIRDRQPLVAFAIYLLCHYLSPVLDYGINGIHLILIFYLFAEHPMLSAIAAGAYMLRWCYGGQYKFFGIPFKMEIFAMPAVLFCCLPLPKGFRLPRWFTYSFYPLHLIVLIILSYIMGIRQF